MKRSYDWLKNKLSIAVPPTRFLVAGRTVVVSSELTLLSTPQNSLTIRHSSNTPLSNRQSLCLLFTIQVFTMFAITSIGNIIMCPRPYTIFEIKMYVVYNILYYFNIGFTRLAKIKIILH